MSLKLKSLGFTILWLLLVPIFFLLIFLPVLVFRTMVICFVTLFKKNWTIVPPRSGAYVVDHMYSLPCNGNLVVLIRFQGILNLGTMHQQFLQRVLNKPDKSNGKILYPELRQQTVNFLGFYFRTPAQHFSLAHHIRLVEKNLLENQDLETYYESLINLPFKGGTSPWEMILIPQREITQTYMFFRMHHSMGDGFAITQMLINDLTGYDHDVIIPSRLKNQARKSVLRTLKQLLKIPYEIVHQAVQCSDNNCLFNRQVKLTKNYYLTITDQISVDQVKKLKSEFPETSFTAVILTALTGAVRDFYQKRFPSHPLPEFIHVSTPIQLPNRTEALQNYHSFALIRLPIGLEDRREQLSLIKQWIHDMSVSTLPASNAVMFPITGFLNHGLTKVLTENRFNSIITSVFPGPTKPCVYAECHPVLEFTFAGGLLHGQQGIGFFLISYNGKFRIVTTIDKALVKCKEEARTIANFVHKELKMDTWLEAGPPKPLH